MVTTNFAVGNAAYTQQSRSSSASTAPQASASKDGYSGSVESEQSVSPQAAYADTAAPSINPAQMDTSFGTLVAAGVCALVVFSCCCAGNQNGNRG